MFSYFADHHTQHSSSSSSSTSAYSTAKPTAACTAIAIPTAGKKTAFSTATATAAANKQQSHYQHHYQQQQQHQHLSCPPLSVPPPPLSVTAAGAGGGTLTPKSEPRCCTLPPQKLLQRMRRNKSDEFEEYGQEILEAMQENESKAMVDPCYMLDQPELSWAMRQTLITWLVQVHAQYNLQPETLYLAISIIDRISSVRPVTKSHYQLIGTTALWIAAKYEENHGRVPSLKNLAFICTNNYLESEFVATERLMLRLLGFDLGHPTPEAFLKAFHAATECTGDSRASELASAQVLSIARYLMEIGAVAAPAGFFIKRRPSVLATAALHLAEIIFAGSALPNSHAITYSPAVAAAARDPNIMQCVQVLSNLVGKGCEVVRQKYISKTHHEASHIVHGWQRNQVLLAARAAAVPPLLPSSPAAAYRHLYGSHQHYHHHHHHHHRASQQQQQSESSPYFQHHQQQQLLLNPNHHQHQYAADVGVQFPTCPPPGLLTPPKDLIGWGGYTPVHI